MVVGTETHLGVAHSSGSGGFCRAVETGLTQKLVDFVWERGIHMNSNAGGGSKFLNMSEKVICKALVTGSFKIAEDITQEGGPTSFNIRPLGSASTAL